MFLDCIGVHRYNCKNCIGYLLMFITDRPSEARVCVVLWESGVPWKSGILEYCVLYLPVSALSYVQVLPSIPKYRLAS